MAIPRTNVLASFLLVLLVLGGCTEPAEILDAPDASDEPVRRTLPVFTADPDAPQSGRIRPTAQPASQETGNDTPTPTSSSPASPATTTSGAPAATTSPATTSASPSPTTTAASPTTTTAAPASPSPTPTTSSASPSPTTNATSPSPTPLQQGERRIVLDAVDRSMEPGFTVDINGTGAGRVGAVQLVDGFGTVAFNNTTWPTFAYERIPWPEFDYTIYQALAVQEQSWAVFWFYCQASSLTWVYFETTHGEPLRVEQANGTCADGAAAPVAVEFPATNMSLPRSAATQTIDGPNIRFADGAGWLQTSERNWTIFAFQVVDCSSACGSPGWHELHVVLWNETSARAAFAILYLRSESPDEVTMLYGLRMPTLVRMSDTFEATWTA